MRPEGHGALPSPRGHVLSTAAPTLTLAPVDPKVGLASHLSHGAGTIEFLSPAACPGGLIPGGQAVTPIPRSPVGPHGWWCPGPGWGLGDSCYCAKRRKENNPVYGKGASAAAGQQPSWGGQRPFVGKTGSEDFQDPAGHPPAARPSFCQFSEASASHQLPVCPSTCHMSL